MGDEDAKMRLFDVHKCVDPVKFILYSKSKYDNVYRNIRCDVEVRYRIREYGKRQCTGVKEAGRIHLSGPARGASRNKHRRQAQDLSVKLATRAYGSEGEQERRGRFRGGIALAGIRRVEFSERKKCVQIYRQIFAVNLIL